MFALYFMNRKVEYMDEIKNKFIEIKNKFIEAIKKIDFEKLNISELKTLAEITGSVEKMAKKDYSELLMEKFSPDHGFVFSSSDTKTIAELK